MGNTAATNTVLGKTKFSQGISGSHTQLTDGTSYLIAGSNVTITTGSNGAVTIASTGGLSTVTGTFNDVGAKFVTTASFSAAGGQGFNYSAASAGTDVYFYVSGSTGSGSGQSLFGGNVTVSGAINATSVAVGGGYGNTGANLNPNGNISTNGIILADSGFSGSLTRLATGGSYIIASSNMSVVSASNGAITLSAVPQGSNNQIQFNATNNFGASSNLWYDNSGQKLYVTGGIQTSGDIIASTNTARAIFSAVISPNTISIGGAGSTTAVDELTVGGGYGSAGSSLDKNGSIEANGSLTVDGISTLTGDVTFGGNIVADTNEAKSIFTAVTTNAITMGGATSRLVAGGNDIRGTAAGSLRVGVASAQVLVLSGGAAASVNPINYNDANFHVSGTIGSIRTTTKGTSVFGGDTVVSGNFGFGGGEYLINGLLAVVAKTQVAASSLDGKRIVRFTGHGSGRSGVTLPFGAAQTGRLITIINADTSGGGQLDITGSLLTTTAIGGDATFALALVNGNNGSSIDLMYDGTRWNSLRYGALF
jgi:hypothetical protein